MRGPFAGDYIPRLVIRHIVLFRFTADATPAQIESAGVALRAMHGAVPELHEVTFGPNLGPTAAEWPYVLIVTTDDMPSVERYLTHPVHVETVGRYVAPIRAGRLAIDVETA